MHIVVVNGSSYGRRGVTSMITTPFCDGIRSAGGTVETVALNKLDIHPCRGDLSCWFKTRNVCVQKDDMAGLVEKFTAADCILIATPVYCDGVPGTLKVMMDRLVVLGSPFLEIRDGHTRHPLPEDVATKRLVLIATCGLWEMDNFTPMVTHLEAYCRNLGLVFTGALLRPHSFAMRNEPVNDLLRAAKNAGRALVEKGTINKEYINCIGRELVSSERYVDMLNTKAACYLQ